MMLRHDPIDPGRTPAPPGEPERRLCVRDRMTCPAVTVRSDATVESAWKLMKTRGIRHLPVVDAGGRLVGIVTDRDLRQVLFDRAMQERLPTIADVLDTLVVRDVMTWGVVTVRPDSDIRQAATLMYEGKLGALPVVEGGRLAGILTESDVLRAFRELLGRRTRRVRPLRAAPAGPYDYGFPVPGGEP